MSVSNQLRFDMKAVAIISLLFFFGCSKGESVDQPTFEKATSLNKSDKKKTTSKDKDKEKNEEEDDERPQTEDEKNLEKALDSDCVLFNTRNNFAFGEKPANFDKMTTNINHYPPAKYTMPPHLTWPEGYWDGDDFIFTASVDIRISYDTHKTTYEERWKSVLPSDPENSDYERVFYEITIEDADSDGCEENISYTKVD